MKSMFNKALVLALIVCGVVKAGEQPFPSIGDGNEVLTFAQDEVIARDILRERFLSKREPVSMRSSTLVERAEFYNTMTASAKEMERYGNFAKKAEQGRLARLTNYVKTTAKNAVNSVKNNVTRLVNYVRNNKGQAAKRAVVGAAAAYVAYNYVVKPVYNKVKAYVSKPAKTPAKKTTSRFAQPTASSRAKVAVRRTK